MDNTLVTVSKISFYDEIVKITPRGEAVDIALVPEILDAFDNCLKDNAKYFLLDLQHLHELPPSLIVAIFEVTAQVRRRGGEVNLVNLTHSGREDILRFKAFEYLTESAFENTAVNRFEERLISQQRKDKKEDWDFNSQVVESIHQTSVVDEVFVEIPSRVDALYKACDFVVDISRNMGFPDAEVSKIKIAVYEACINVIEHAYHSDPYKTVKVGVESFSNMLRVTVYDKGEGFNLPDQFSFDATEAVNNRKRGGMGLPIIKRSMDDVQYIADPEGENRLIMTKSVTSRE